MVVKRTERVASLILQEVSRVLLRDLRDPRLAAVTFTRVRMTADLRIARIYFSMMGTPEQVESAETALKKAKGVFKKEIGRNLRLRYLPELEFFYDRNLEYAEHIENILRRLKEEEQSPEEKPADEKSD